MIRWGVPRTDSRSDPAPKPVGSRPRLSAGAIPCRINAAGECEVFWVLRAEALRFMGGWHAFPGGRLAGSDADLPSLGTVSGSEAYKESGAPAAHPECALRELFEEAGILVATGPMPTADQLNRARRALLEDDLDFTDWLRRHGLRLDASRLRFAGRWVTPPLSPIRFDATFFVLEWRATEQHQPSVIPGELSRGEWIPAREALKQWAVGEVLLAQPTLATLRALAADGMEGCVQLWGSEAHAPNMPRAIEFRPAVRVVPVRTRTLPPATHTNALLLGSQDLVLVDPGSDDRAEQRRLYQIIDAEIERGGGRLTAVWLSHHHRDHVAGAEDARRRFDVPIVAHEATVARLSEAGIRIDRRFHGGECVDLDGPTPLRVQVHHTPGHASGHLCFYEENTRTLLCGDMFSGFGTVVVSPPDGSMNDYVNSLERLGALGAKVMLPSHGTMSREPSEALAKARSHRLWREDRVMQAWSSGKRDPEAMLDTVYGPLDERLRPFAVRQILAHLERLEAIGQIEALPATIHESLGRAEPSSEDA